MISKYFLTTKFAESQLPYSEQGVRYSQVCAEAAAFLLTLCRERGTIEVADGEIRQGQRNGIGVASAIAVTVDFPLRRDPEGLIDRERPQ